MDSTLLALGFVLVALITLLASGVWVAVSLLGIGIGALAIFTPVPLGDLVIGKVWEASGAWPMTAPVIFNPVVQMAALKQPVDYARFRAFFPG